MEYIGGVIKIYPGVVYNPPQTNSLVSVFNTSTTQESSSEAKVSSSVILKFNTPTTTTQTTSVGTSITEPSVILNLSNTAVTNIQTSTSVNGSSTVNEMENEEAVQVTENRNRYTGRVGKVNLKHFLDSTLENIGAIKSANDPVQYALNRINDIKSLIDSLISNLKDKFFQIQIYEQGSKTGDFYQYSADIQGKNLRIHAWVQNQKGTVNYSLDMQIKNAKIHEWISANTNTNEVNYSLDVQTKKMNVHEFFQNTQANYAYSLNINRA